MPKTYTTKTFDPKDFTDSETFNNESSNILSNFNGVLDAAQLPYETMERENFVAIAESLLILAQMDPKPLASES